jgi:hypothetical protein
MDEKPVESQTPRLPDPILDDREYAELARLNQRYEKLTAPGPIAKAARKAGEIVPARAKDAVAGVGNAIAEQQIYEQAVKLASDGFNTIEKQLARFTISEGAVIKSVNKVCPHAPIERLDQMATLRSYDVAKAANGRSIQHYALAFAEGGGTGAFGFAGIPANLVTSTLFYYRAVQAVALSYGYDVKNDPSELVIASEVFSNALSPASPGRNDVSDNVAKFMAISSAEGVKQAAKKGWAAMVERGGPALLLAQMRALAHTSAAKALQNAGEKGLERNLFKEIFEQVGRRLTLKSIQKAVPYVSAGIGALVDTAQMNTVLQYAEIFYHKRFIVEKPERLRYLYGAEAVDILEEARSDQPS